MSESAAPKTVLVTGATGMLGSHIVDRLVQRGADVVALDLAAPEPGYAWESGEDRVTSLRGDITDRAVVQDAVDRVDAIVHVAAVLAKAEGDPPGPLMAVNVVGTHSLFEAAAAAGKKVVFASSGSVYGPNRTAIDGEPAPAFVETDPPHDLGFYALSKQVNELYADAFARVQGLRWAAMRCGAMFGPRLRMGLTTRHLLSVLDDIDAGRVPQVNGDPDSGLDWVNVEDAAEVIARAVTTDIPNGPINVSTGRATRLEDVLRTLLRVVGADETIEWVGDRKPTGVFTSARYYNNDRSAQLLGFRPSADLEVGLRSFAEWRNGVRSR